MIKLISVGKLKQKYFVVACDDYCKRIENFHKIKKIIVDDEKEDNNLSPKLIQNIKNKEAKKILSHIEQNDYVVALIIDGKQYESIELAEHINSIFNSYSKITFVIGGSHGLGEDVCSRANMKLSMSKMTFAHGLAKVILCEQIYRVLNILNNTKYHK